MPESRAILVIACLLAQMPFVSGTQAEPAQESEIYRLVSDSEEPVGDVRILERPLKIHQLVGDYDRQYNRSTLSLTDTRYKVWGTDLGVPFRHGNLTYVLFGDTIGPKGGDTIAYTSDTTPDDGLLLDFVDDGAGVYQPITIPGVSTADFEVPTEGVSVGGQMYVYHTTDHSAQKTMGRSVLAVSADNGRTFTFLYNVSVRHFINVAVVEVDVSDWPGLPSISGAGHVIFGGGDYRASNVSLGFQSATEIGTNSSIRYFTGTDPNGTPIWNPAESTAVPLFDQPCFGEFSVSFNRFIDRWIMMYNCGNPRGINLRTAVAPWGPWSDAQVIFDPWADGGYCQFMHTSWQFQKCDWVHDPGRENEWGGEYGPYEFSDFATGNQTETSIYFTLSTWNPYSVMLMRAKLGRSDAPPADPAISGPASLEVNVSGNFSLKSVDPDGQDIRFHVSFGDATNQTTLFVPSGSTVPIYRSWSGVGNYTISVVAEDRSGMFSSASLWAVAILQVNRPPSAAIDKPTASAVVNGMVVVVGRSADPENGNLTTRVSVDGGAWNTANGSADWDWSWDTTLVADGEHVLLAEADDGKRRAISAPVSVTVKNTVPPPPRPDLAFVVSSMVVTPLQPVEGELVTIGITVSNFAAAIALKAVAAAYNGSVELDRTGEFDLSENGTGTVYLNWVATAGTLQITLKLDPQDVVAEQNETNNRFEFQLKVGAKPAVPGKSWGFSPYLLVSIAVVIVLVVVGLLAGALLMRRKRRRRPSPDQGF